MMHVIHRYYPPSNCNESNSDQVDKHSYYISMSGQYVKYKCIWTPEIIQYYINENLVHEISNQDYDWWPIYNVRVRLSQQVLQGYNLLGQEIAPITPQTTYFDWVKVKRFFLSPEITCPNIICSTGTATLDVDTLASNITWQISPSYSVTTSSGSGLTANLTAASTYSGEATITYSFEMPSGETFEAEKTFWVKPSIEGQYAQGTSWNELYTVNFINSGETTVINVDSEGSSATFNWQLLPESSTVSWGSYNLDNSIIGFNIISGNQASFSVSTTNACGNTVSKQFYFMIMGGYYLTLTPNPASTDVAITIESTSNEAFDNTKEWELEIFDKQQKLKQKKSKIKGKETKLNTSGWKKGIYIVRVKFKDELLSTKLVIK